MAICSQDYMLVMAKAGRDAAYKNALAQELSLCIGREQGQTHADFFHAHTWLLLALGTTAFGKENSGIPGIQHFPRTIYFRILNQQKSDREHQNSLEKSVPRPNREQK